MLDILSPKDEDTAVTDSTHTAVTDGTHTAVTDSTHTAVTDSTHTVLKLQNSVVLGNNFRIVTMTFFSTNSSVYKDN
jgi:hypothetical protein